MRKISYYPEGEDICHYLYIDDNGNAAYEQYSIEKELLTDHLNNLSESEKEEWLSKAYEIDEEIVNSEEEFASHFLSSFDVHSGTATANEDYTFDVFLKELKTLVKDVFKWGDCYSVEFSNVTTDYDTVPYQETHVNTPEYIDSYESEVEFNNPIVEAADVEEYFDKDWEKAKKFIESNKENENYVIETDLKGRYEGTELDVHNVTIKFKFDENNNIITINNSIQASKTEADSFNMAPFDIQKDDGEFFGYTKVDNEYEAKNLEKEASKWPDVTETVCYEEDGKWHVGIKGPIH